MSRNTMIARIHLAKSKARICWDCGTAFYGVVCPKCGSTCSNVMREDLYRQRLKCLTGKGSCTEMDDAELRKVMDFFDRAGFSAAYPYESPSAAQRRSKYAVTRQIERRAKMVLGPDWEGRVKGFVRVTIRKDGLCDLTANELRKVIGWINRTDKYQRKGEKK